MPHDSAHLIPGQHIHLVGIGGFGLSAIARVLLRQGYRVSGSDRASNALTQALAAEGAQVYLGHDARYVEGADALIVSSAVAADHVEVRAAEERGIPVYRRADVMASLMRGKFVIAVAGTHGKTTTTAMIVHILRECGHDPSYIVGGVMRNTGTNADVGRGDLFVVEADEYDNMFHGLRPNVIVLTSVEYDHPDCFRSPAELVASFAHFVSLLDGADADSGVLVACADDEQARLLAEKHHAAGHTVYTYGLSPDAIFRAENVHVDGEGCTAFDLVLPDRSRVPARLPLPGVHNVKNALGVLGVAQGVIGLPLQKGVAALETFQGTGRRFEVRGEVDGVVVVDDYAHHPTAIKTTLEAARMRYPGHALWAVWQPHTYSRTQSLMDAYLGAFQAADHVLITDIYAAREDPIPGVTSAALVAAMQHPDVRHTPSLQDAVDVLETDVRAPAIVLIMSAGDAPQIGIEYLARRERLQNS